MDLQPLELEFRQGAGGSKHGTATAHVELHQFDLAAAHLEVVTARIKGEAFAHQGEPALHRALRANHQVQETGRDAGPLGHGQIGPHAALAAGRFIEHGELAAELIGDGAGGGFQAQGIDHIGRGCHQLAGQDHALANGFLLRQLLIQLAG